MHLSNPSAVPRVDLLFTWYSKIANIECECRLRIYKITFDKFIVIVSELPDNSGPTISEEASTLIHLVLSKFALESTQTMWLEHYPHGYLNEYFKDEETYERVILFLDNIWSEKIDKRQVESLLKVKLES